MDSEHRSNLLDLTGYTPPTHCFCQIPQDCLLYWGKQRYQENKGTLELLQSNPAPNDQEAIIIVSLLDLDDDVTLQVMSNVDRVCDHILACRDAARQLLLQHNILMPHARTG